MRKTVIILTLTAICALTGIGAASQSATLADRLEKRRPAAVNPVVQWNRTLLAIVRTAGAQPSTIHPTRSFAIMHAAIYDAVNSIERSHRPYMIRVSDAPRDASQDAAAAAAAHDVLVALYPAFKASLDTELQDSLGLADDGNRTEGLRIGQIVAARLLAARQDDGSASAPIPYTFGTAPGDYQSTPPNFPKQPQFTHWARVTPFALPRADLFRPAPPPALTSDRYSDAFDEVKTLGTASGATSSADQALTGRFWNGPIQNYWNEIAQSVTDARHLRTADRARVFALLDLTIADGVIAFYDAKYTYNSWRPVTAIRSAVSLGNPETIGDPNWLPEVGNTPPDPSYPGAHAVVSAAAADVLITTLKRDRFVLDVTSEVLPGVTRSFRSLSDAAEEATLSRIFAGVHFRFDETAGRRLGEHIADFVTDNFLTRHGDKDDDPR